MSALRLNSTNTGFLTRDGTVSEPLLLNNLKKHEKESITDRRIYRFYGFREPPGRSRRRRGKGRTYGRIGGRIHEHPFGAAGR